MRKIDAFAHILPPWYARRLESVAGDTIANIEALGLPEADAAAIFAGNTRTLPRLPA